MTELIDPGFRRRTRVAIAVGLLAVVIYALMHYYSPRLVAYVVEQTLIQKAPAGVGAEGVRRRLRAVLARLPDDKIRLHRLLQISQAIEKHSRLDSAQLELLLEDRGQTR